MNALVEIDKIENMIYEIRGKQVMLDSDLAKLYECKNGTKTINLAVKRNIDRFPDRFVFKLTKEECEYISRFQIETLKGKGHNIKYLPNVFTEEGVAMLATVLKTKISADISVRIMDAFVSMRKYISNNLLEQKYINNIVLEDHERINLLEESFNKLEEKRKVNEIYFNGQIYDAYSKIIDILKEAKNEVVIIDGYADKIVLDIISKLNINVTIICKPNCLLSKADIEKYNKQYSNLKVKFDNTFHDRYFMLDNSILYHCGTSINRIGYKTFSINKVEDMDVINLIIDKVTKLKR